MAKTVDGEHLWNKQTQYRPFHSWLCQNKGVIQVQWFCDMFNKNSIENG